MSLRALEIARSALVARQADLELTGQNVANANTPGYCRRRLILSERVGESSNGVPSSGLGVEVTGVQRLGDRLLEAQVNVETGHLGQESTAAQGLSDVEALVAGADGLGLQTPLNALFDTFSDVAADPGAAAPRTALISAADSLCDSFRSRASDLRSALTSNDQQVVTTVQRVNQLATQVADLNRQIGEAGGAGKSPELEESRDGAIKELAQLCGAVGVPRDNGTTDVLLGGHHLVQADQADALDLVADPANPGLHTVSFKGETPPSALAGNLAGYLQTRSTGLAAAQRNLNSFAASVADTLNAAHQAGYALDGTTNHALFTYDAADPAATLQVSADIKADPNLIAASGAADQPGNGDAALALEGLRTTPAAGQSKTLLTQESDYLAGLGNDVKLAQSKADARQTVTTSLESRAEALSSVSLDEEAVHLSEVEKAYTAAQRIVQVALAMIDEVLQIGQ